MNTVEIEQLRSKADAKHSRKREDADAEYARTIAAIDEVAKLLSEEPDEDAPVQSSLPASIPTRKATRATAVHTALTGLPATFSVKDVETRIRAIDPTIVTDRREIAGILGKMASRGEVRQVVKAIGRRPATYENLRAQPSARSTSTTEPERNE